MDFDWSCRKCGNDLRETGAYELCLERNQYDFEYDGTWFQTGMNAEQSRIIDCEQYHCLGCGHPLEEDQTEALEEIRM